MGRKKTIMLTSILLALCVSTALSQATSGFLIEAEFLQSECIAGTEFTTAPGAGQLNQGNFVNFPDLSGFTCPTIRKGDLSFSNAANGFTTNNNNAIRSENPLLDGIFNPSVGAKDHSWEFFLFIDDTDRLTNGEEFVLAEIGQNVANPNAWNLGSDYVFRLSYRQNNQDEILLEIVGDTYNCQFAQGSEFRANVNSLFHLVLTFQANDSGVSEFTCFVNGVEVDSSIGDPDLDINVGLTANDYFLFLGTSPESRVGGSNINSMPCDMNLFRVYNRLLTPAEVLTNFEELIENSLPSAADFSLDHIEDSVTEINFTSAIFDFDQDVVNPQSVALGLGSVNQNLRVRVLTDPSRGSLNIGNPPVSLALDVLEVNYEQTTENEDDGTDTFTFLVFEQNQESASSEGANTVTLQFQESNDDPQAIDAAFRVAELQEVTVLLTAQDEDDAGPGKETIEFRPSQFTIEAISIDQATDDSGTRDVGFFRYCDNLTVVEEGFIVEVGDNTGVGQTVFTGAVCFLADAFDNQPDAVIGAARITYSVQDDAGGDSKNLPQVEQAFQQATATVTVQQALSSGCQFLPDPASCETFVSEDGGFDNENKVTIKLQGFDSRCDQTATPDPNCAGENGRFARRRIVITSPLPDPNTEGTLFFTLNNFDSPITEADLDSSGRFVVEDILPDTNDDNSFELKFQRVNNYFNLSPFPICIDASRSGSAPSNLRGQCAQIDDTFGSGPNFDPLLEVCQGKFCNTNGRPEFLTTGPLLEDEVEPATPRFGQCGSLLPIDNGCPVRINTQLALLPQNEGGEIAFSGPSEETSHVIWVENEITAESFQINVEDDYELNIGQLTRFSPPINITDEDSDARVIYISLTINNGASLFFNQEDTTLFNSATEQLTFYSSDPNWQGGINIDTPTAGQIEEGFLIGLTGRINEFLSTLGARIVEERGTSLTIFSEDPFRISGLPQQVNRIDIGGRVVDDDEGNKSLFEELIDRPYTIAGFIVFICICCFCCYKCFENDTCKCIFVGQKVKLVIVKSAEGIGIVKTKVNESLEDVERQRKGGKKYRNGLSDGPDAPKRRGKKKYEIKSHRDQNSVVASKRGLKQDKNKMKKGPVQSYRTGSESSRPARSKRSGVKPPRGPPPKPDSDRI